MVLDRHAGLTERIIGAAIAVHRGLGPGLLESACRRCLMAELETVGLEVRAEVPLDIVWRGQPIEAAYRLDLEVEDAVVVEVKAVEKLSGIHEAQLLAYLRLPNRHVGLLLNCNVVRLANGGLKRLALGQQAALRVLRASAVGLGLPWLATGSRRRQTSVRVTGETTWPSTNCVSTR